MALSLPDIHLTDLGTNNDGITPAALTRTVLKAVTTATVKAVSAAAGDLGKGLENLGKDAAGGTDADMDKVKKSLGGCSTSKLPEIFLRACDF